MDSEKKIPVPLPSAGERVGVVVLASGEYPGAEPAASILRNAARVVCCDGASAGFIAAGGRPLAIVGDGDSLGPGIRELYADIIHIDPDQETNDLTKAVRFCMARGLEEITILGATGKREDHTIGNVSLLADYAAEGARVRMVTEYGVFEPMCGHCRFESFPGQQVSIFALSPLTTVTTHDLKFPLREAHLRGWWPGTLNEAMGEEFAFTTSGPAIVYRLFPGK